MIHIPIPQVYSVPSEFVRDINAAMLKEGKVWAYWVGTVAGKSVELKTYGRSYLQIMRVDGINHGGRMDMKVGEWKTELQLALTANSRTTNLTGGGR